VVAGSSTRVNPQLLLGLRGCRGRLSVQRNGLQGKTRCYTVATGFGPSHELGVYNNGVDTAERALVERYFLCAENGGFRPALPVQQRAFSSNRFKEFRKAVLQEMPALPRLTMQQVVDAYVGPKRRMYQQVLNDFSMKDFTIEDALLNMFVKFEKQNILKAPRGINPRSPRYNLKLGTYLKHAEHHFFKAINRVYAARTRATVIKGFNAAEAAAILWSKWLLFSNPVAVGLDASKFDMHVSRVALKYEHSFYTALYPGAKRLKELLRWQLRNKGRAYFSDGRIKFSIDGTRASGDLNTSLGNCILMCSMVWVYAQERGVVVELANNGDDCVVFMERDDLDRFMRGLDGWFRARGFAMTCEKPVYEFEKVEFCQTHPVRLGGQWQMVRNHAAVLTKDPMCLLSIPNDKVYRKWLHAVGTCGGIAASGCPVQEAFYEAFRRNANGAVSSTGMQEYVYKNTSQLHRIRGLGRNRLDVEARVSYWAAFGVLPDEQVCLEKRYANIILGGWRREVLGRSQLEHELAKTGVNIFIENA